MLTFNSPNLKAYLNSIRKLYLKDFMRCVIFFHTQNREIKLKMLIFEEINTK